MAREVVESSLGRRHSCLGLELPYEVARRREAALSCNFLHGIARLLESALRELPQHDISADAPARLHESYVALKQDILDALLTLQAEGKEPQERPAASAWADN